MVACPSCGTEVQPDWDWCHACGWDPEAKLPATTTVTHPEVLKTELVPSSDRRPVAPGAPPTSNPTRPRERHGPGYAPNPSRTPLLVAIGGIVAIALVVLALVVVGRGDTPAATTAERPQASFTTTTALAVTPWALPEGDFKVDLPIPLAAAPTPEVPFPFVSGVAYTGGVDGREYVVAALAVHPAYEWEDIGRAMIDVEDSLGAQHGFTVISRSAGAFKEMSSSRFTFVAPRAPDETEAAFAARKEGPASGEGIAFVTGNHLYVVLVKGQTLGQANFAPVLDSIVVV